MAIALLSLGMVSGCNGSAAGPSKGQSAKPPADATPATTATAGEHAGAASPNKPQTVELIVDYGDGARKSSGALPWRERLTVRAVMDEAKDHPHGITYSAHGTGEQAILTKLDDLENQTGANAKDWLFYVNDRMGDKSFDAWTVRPGDVILWKFAVYE